jgi:hypothetical protein
MPIQAKANPEQTSNTSVFRWAPAKYAEVVEALNGFEDETREWVDGADQDACYGGLGYVLEDKASGDTLAVVRGFAGQAGPKFLAQTPKSITLHLEIKEAVMKACYGEAE